MGLWLREVEAVLDWLGVGRCHQAIWYWKETAADAQGDPAAAFVHRLTEKRDVADTEFLVDGAGYLTALSRHDLSGHLDYHYRNHIEKWWCSTRQYQLNGKNIISGHPYFFIL